MEILMTTEELKQNIKDYQENLSILVQDLEDKIEELSSMMINIQIDDIFDISNEIRDLSSSIKFERDILRNKQRQLNKLVDEVDTW